MANPSPRPSSILQPLPSPPAATSLLSYLPAIQRLSQRAKISPRRNRVRQSYDLSGSEIADLTNDLSGSVAEHATDAEHAAATEQTAGAQHETGVHIADTHVAADYITARDTAANEEVTPVQSWTPESTQETPTLSRRSESANSGFSAFAKSRPCRKTNPGAVLARPKRCRVPSHPTAAREDAAESFLGNWANPGSGETAPIWPAQTPIRHPTRRYASQTAPNRSATLCSIRPPGDVCHSAASGAQRSARRTNSATSTSAAARWRRSGGATPPPAPFETRHRGRTRARDIGSDPAPDAHYVIRVDRCSSSFCNARAATIRATADRN